MEPTPTKRFRIAFSFAGERRDFVAQVAAILAERFGEDAILYDKYHEAEFARHDLGIYLPKLYGEQSDLIVPVLCPNYDAKLWTGWEWLHIYGLLTRSDGQRVMPTRFEHANADVLSPTKASPKTITPNARHPTTKPLTPPFPTTSRASNPSSAARRNSRKSAK